MIFFYIINYTNIHIDLNSKAYFCAVDFVLRDPREKDDDKKEVLPPHREELAVVPKPWNKTYLANQAVAKEHLHVTNPCMSQVLQLWHNSFK